MQQVSASRPTVILISGFGANARNLNVIRKRFLKDGFNVLVLALDWKSLSDGVRGLYRMAELLSSTVLRLRKQPGMRHSKVYLVAHSAGGLVARHYVQMLGGSHYCEALVTLATPHHGTWVAALGLATHLVLKARCLVQMTPLSSLIKTINSAPFPNGFRMVSIFSGDDLLCPPSSTRLPDGWVLRHYDVQTVEIDNLSHSDFLLSKDCYQALLRSIKPEAAKMPVTPAAIVPAQ